MLKKRKDSFDIKNDYMYFGFFNESYIKDK